MKKSYKYFMFSVILLTTFNNKGFTAENLQELPEVVVTASKILEPLEETTTEAIVLTEKEMKKMNVNWVVEALRKLPDVYVKQSGGPGKQTSVFLRTSTKSGDILVMIDGIKVNSPTTGDFDFSSLSVDEIERIEIIEGPQSTLYGSEAVAGVINIITKKGKGKPKINLSAESGSYGTYKPAFNLAGGNDKINYRITTFYYKSDGFSAYDKGKEKDQYKETFISGRFGFSPSEKLEFEVLGRYYYDRSEIDFGTEGFRMEPDDPDYTQKRNHSLISGKIKLNLTPKWESLLTISKLKEILRTKDPDDLYNFYSSKITPAVYVLDWQHNFLPFKNSVFTLGAEYRKEKGKYEGSSVYDQAIENKAVYFNTKLKFLKDNLILNGGVRYDNHQTFGEKVTYKIGFLYSINPYSLRIKGNYGTAFKAPTLNNLFWPNMGWSMGNPNLKPEESQGWNISGEKDFLNHKTTFFLSYFYQKYENLINWVEITPWVYQPQNIGKASIKGFETTLKFYITSNLKLKTSYTYLDTENKDTKKYLIYKPNHKFSIIGEYSTNRFSFLADYTYTGKRYDDSNNRIRLKPYSLVNLSATYKLNSYISFFGKVDNLLNTNYEEVKNYGTPDRSFYLGIRLSY